MPQTITSDSSTEAGTKQELVDLHEASNWTIEERYDREEANEEGVLARTGWVDASVVGEKNQNNRVYPQGLWESVLNEDRIQEKLERNTMLGEVDHPEDTEISITDSAIRITDMRKKPSNQDIVQIKFDIMDVPEGRVLDTYIKAGTQLGVSSRGLGSLEQSDGEFVVNEDDYELVTFDVVADPGFSSAVVEPDAVESLTEALETLSDESDADTQQIAEKLIDELNSDSNSDRINSSEENATMGETKEQLEEMSELVSEKEDTIRELQESVENLRQENKELKGEDEQSLQEDLSELEEKYEVALEALEEYQEQGDKLDQIRQAKMNEEEKFETACEVIESYREQFETACEVIEELREDYYTAIDVLEEWQAREEQEELNQYIDEQLAQRGLSRDDVPGIVEQSSSRREFDRLIQDFDRNQSNQSVRERRRQKDQGKSVRGNKRQRPKSARDRSSDKDVVRENLQATELESLEEGSSQSNGERESLDESEKSKLKQQINNVT